MDYSAIIVAVISSGLLSTIITQVIATIGKRRDAKAGTTAAIRLVLKDRLRYLAQEYIEQGWIYIDELEDLCAMHTCYHDTLHGNGYLDTLMDKVKHLEVRGVTGRH